MKPATNGVGRAVVELERPADLFDVAGVHHDDDVGHGHRLDLVVGDVDGGGPEPLVQRLDLGAHLHAELGVEVRERLVEEEHLGAPHDGAPHGDALALAAGELPRQAREQVAEVEDAPGLLDLAAAGGGVDAAQAQREGQVVLDGLERVERVVLKHHRDVPVLRVQVVDDAAVDRHLAGRDLLEAGDHPEQRRLAAARGADEHDELTVLDLDRDAVHHLQRAVVLLHVADADVGHRRPPVRARARRACAFAGTRRSPRGNRRCRRPRRSPARARRRRTPPSRRAGSAGHSEAAGR